VFEHSEFFPFSATEIRALKKVRCPPEFPKFYLVSFNPENTRSGLLTLHSLVPERFFKVQKDLPFDGRNSASPGLKQSAVLTFQVF
jgi:hypothetical protein